MMMVRGGLNRAQSGQRIPIASSDGFVRRGSEVAIRNGFNPASQFRVEPHHAGKSAVDRRDNRPGSFRLELGFGLFGSPKFQSGAIVLSAHFPAYERGRA